MIFWKKDPRTGLATGLVFFILPLLHVYPTGMPVAGHPSGQHLPALQLQSLSSMAADVAATRQCAAGEGSGPVILVVQDARHRSTDTCAPCSRTVSIRPLRGPVKAWVADALASAAPRPYRPPALAYQHRPQAPPATRTRAARGAGLRDAGSGPSLCDAGRHRPLASISGCRVRRRPKQPSSRCP
jgi:hypothetical protein